MSEDNLEANVKKPLNYFKWLFYLSVLLLLVILYFNFQNRSEIENSFAVRSKALDERIHKLEIDNGSLAGDLSAKNNLLLGYMPYLSLIKNLKLTDTAYKSLPFRYGQRIKILPDSSDAVINAICVTANDLEYSVKYIVRNKKGELVPISVSDIFKPE